MNAHAHITPTQLALYEAQKARSARLGLNAKPAAKPRLVANKAQPVAANDEGPSLAELERRRKAVWAALTGEEMLLVKFFEAACWLSGHEVETITGYSRKRPIAMARRAVIRSVAHRFPEVTPSRIARLVKKDHTTVLYAMGQTERSEASGVSPLRSRPPMKRKPIPMSVQLEASRMRQELGITFEEIGKRLGIGSYSANKFHLRHTPGAVSRRRPKTSNEKGTAK